VAFLENPGGWAAFLGTKTLVGLRPPKLNLLDQEIKTDTLFDRVNIIISEKANVKSSRRPEEEYSLRNR
jgi:hypothetical protein